MTSTPFTITVVAGSSVDGSAGAPSGAPQYPTLLNGRAARPPWKVAGVDYAVGVHPGVTMKTPTTANLPSGVDNSRPGALYIEGNNVTLKGFDLSGYTVYIDTPATGTVTVTDCICTGGTKSVNIRSAVAAKASLVVTYCTFDCGGLNSDSDFQTIKVWTPLTVQYCLIKNSPAASYSGSKTLIQFNALVAMCFNGPQGGHANAIYVEGGSNIVIQYNTLWSGNTQSGGVPVGLGAAIALFDDGGSYTNTNISNNVVISDLQGGASYLIGYYIHSPNTATGGVVSTNYGFWANGGGFGMFYGGSTGTVQATYSGNIDMSTGQVVNGP